MQKPNPQNPTTLEADVHLRDYWQVIRKRKNTVWTFFALLFIVVAIGTFTATPVYRASCDILIQRDTPGGVDFLTVETQSRFAALEFYPTQYEIIRSAAVARRVVGELDLLHNPVFNPELREESIGFLDSARDALKKLLGKGPVGEDSPEDTLVENLLESLSVKPVKDSQVTRIFFDSESPELAASVANAVAAAYISLSLDMKMGASKEAIHWLTRKIEDQRTKLDRSETALQKYMRENDIVAIENRDTVTPRKIQEVNSQLIEAESKRRELMALVHQLEPGVIDSRQVETIPVVMNDQIFQRLRSEEIDIAGKIEEMAKKYGPKHPEMIRIRTEQQSVLQRKKDEITRILTSVQNDLDFARARENTFREQLEQTKAEAHALSEKSVQYNVLQREVLSNQQIYDALLKRVNEASITGDIRASNITVIDKARPQRRPVKPRKALNLLLSVLLGLFGGIGMAFFLEYLDNTVKAPDDVEDRLGLPFLGLVPKFTAKDVENGVGGTISFKAGSPAAESYRTVRTAITLSEAAQDRNRVLLVTSSVAEEGKTTTAANLAAVMARNGDRVILIDADMRRPSLHRRFEVENEKGLSTRLGGLDEKTESVSCGIENLDLLPSGPIPPNPSELLGNARLRPLLDELKASYDRIVIDSPPVLMVTDAPILSTVADAVVLVVRGGKTTIESAQRGLKHLNHSHATVLGALLNAVDLSRPGYGTYQYYYYAYSGYGDDGGKKPGRKT